MSGISKRHKCYSKSELMALRYCNYAMEKPKSFKNEYVTNGKWNPVDWFMDRRLDVPKRRNTIGIVGNMVNRPSFDKQRLSAHFEDTPYVRGVPSNNMKTPYPEWANTMDMNVEDHKFVGGVFAVGKEDDTAPFNLFDDEHQNSLPPLPTHRQASKLEEIEGRMNRREEEHVIPALPHPDLQRPIADLPSDSIKNVALRNHYDALHNEYVKWMGNQFTYLDMVPQHPFGLPKTLHDPNIKPTIHHSPSTHLLHGTATHPVDGITSAKLPSSDSMMHWVPPLPPSNLSSKRLGNYLEQQSILSNLFYQNPPSIDRGFYGPTGTNRPRKWISDYRVSIPRVIATTPLDANAPVFTPSNGSAIGSGVVHEKMTEVME